MKMSGLLSRRSHDLDGVVGAVRHIRAGSSPHRKLGPKDVAVLDLNRTSADTARALVEAGVAAVIHVPRAGEEMLPRAAFRTLAASTIPVVEDADLSAVAEGTKVRVDEGVVYSVKTEDELASGRESGPATLLAEVDAAESGYVESALAHLANATEFLSLEHPLLLDGEGLPQIDVEFADRHVVVVTGDESSQAQLADLKPFIKEYRPLLVGVDGGAELLRSAKLSADVVVATPTAVSEEVLTDGAVLVVPADRDGRAEGLERVTELGVGATTFPAAATARDMALLLAFHNGAEMIVVTGGDRGLENVFGPSSAPSSTMVDTAVSSRLVHADACSTLYRSRGAGIGLALVVLAALVAVAAVVVARDSAQDLLIWAVDMWNGFALWVQGLVR
ncbi:putative cytokinetic ring protein SteA [uncultured Dietzia sp.]|uniref:putative cytokinetic ring protein SteA n=1 Tax=uncultured Dietzia sp. TaxID=395519 RepID=UPI0026278EE9|nr:putative cytokinetic ring protein SteA [uncultured Dietzia sp.]HMT49292.1 putative cytokinetic ring protein SteA [Dietzia sp.]